MRVHLYVCSNRLSRLGLGPTTFSQTQIANVHFELVQVSPSPKHYPSLDMYNYCSPLPPPPDPVLYENAVAEQKKRAHSIVYGMSAGLYTKLLRLVIVPLIGDLSPWKITSFSLLAMSFCAVQNFHHLSTFTHGCLVCYPSLSPCPNSSLPPFLPLSLFLPLPDSLALCYSGCLVDCSIRSMCRKDT